MMSNIERNEEVILVSMKGISKQEKTSPDEIFLITLGKRCVTKEGYELHYEEIDPETEQLSKTKISVTEDGKRVVMDKIGEYSTSMIFEKGKSYQSHYNTPFGSLELYVYPTKVKTSFREKDGDVFLQYQLNLQGQFIAIHELKIQYALQEGYK